jgi:hypothetical protein
LRYLQYLEHITYPIQMPPKKSAKKRKADDGGSATPPSCMWLLVYEWGGGHNELITEHALFSSKEKAIAGVGELVDKHSFSGNDWRNGLKGFGREEEDDYMGFEFFGDSIGDEGVLLQNDGESGSVAEAVHLKRLKVDP